MSTITDTVVVDVVDDDPGIRSALALLLRAHGWQVRSYRSADAWLERKDVCLPDCLILDLQLPGLDGSALLQRLHDSGVALPVVILTAYPQGVLVARAQALGCREVLTKPAGIARLAEAIRAILAEN